MSILILNGSPNGKKGNCQVLIKKLIQKIKDLPLRQVKTEVLHLSEFTWTDSSVKSISKRLENADGFVFVTGTYWDSWGSPLQLFLEKITDLEGSPAFMGKPVVVLVLNHSVGGKGVLSRLQGVLSTLGCLIPPMSGMVYSWVSDNVAKNKKTKTAKNDLWSLDDLEIILENFYITLKMKVNWKKWPVNRDDYSKVWLR